ncbi:hypothetical protein ACTHQW_13745 [Dietzia maris]|uniref:hypothetical protein n=1 Tax=Dietzia sp. WMMA184 TaxID=2039808 RepID=UPI0011775117|nr:hypothetical protein [Dietzia sp. WMMA184]
MGELLGDQSALFGLATLAVSTVSLLVAGLSLKVVRHQLVTAKKPFGMGIGFGVQEIGISREIDGRKYATCVVNFDVVGPGVLYDVSFHAWTSGAFLKSGSEWVPISKAPSVFRLDSSTETIVAQVVVPADRVAVTKIGVTWADTSRRGGIVTHAVRMLPRPKGEKVIPDALGRYESWVQGKSFVPTRVAQWILRRTARELPSGQVDVPELVRCGLSPVGGRFVVVIEPPHRPGSGPLAIGDRRGKP